MENHEWLVMLLWPRCWVEREDCTGMRGSFGKYMVKWLGEAEGMLGGSTLPTCQEFVLGADAFVVQKRMLSPGVGGLMSGDIE